jgi:membrane-bound serine protease (ClpP class)
VAYIFLMLGFYGLLFELSNPGAILPGIAGGIFIILAFFALQTIPVNYAGLLLILFAFILFIAELKVTSHGLLAAGGIVSLLLGSLLLFDSPVPYWRLSRTVLFPVVGTTAVAVAVALALAVRTHRKPVTTGWEGMVGLRGKAVEKIEPGRAGRVQVHGELWLAASDEAIEPGDAIEVIAFETPLRPRVKRIPA